MENLTEEDFNDAAAAVEGVYGSDEDARSDGYLSWLLVHADNIDPELEFNPNESLIGEKTPGITSTATITNGDGMAENVGSGDEGIFTSPKQDEFDQSVVAISEPVLRVNAPESNGSAQGITTLRPAPQQELEQQMPFVRESPAQPRDRDAPSLTVAPNSTIVPSLKKAVDLTGSHPWTGANGPGGFGTSAADCDLPSSGATNDSACAAALLLQGQLAAAGGIPSDPVLAMQMGARMALAGTLNLIPFPMPGDGRVAGGNPSANPSGASAATAPSGVASSAVQPHVPVKVVQTTIAPAVKPLATAAPASILPALSPASATSSFTGSLPDGISLKVEPSASLIASAGTLAVGEAVHSEGGTSVAGSVADARIGLAAFGGDFGVGEKRPRTPSIATAGRDALRNGRRRKQRSLVELEERVKQVAEDNARLKLHLSDVNDKLKLMASRKKMMETEIAAKLEAQRSVPSEANKASLAEALLRFKDLYADYGAQRKQEVDFHLKQLERQIVPTDTTKMSLWTLDQDKSFYQDKKHGSLSVILRKELGVSEEQCERIQDRRTRIKSLLAEVGESLRLVRDLQKSSEAKNARFEEVMARLQSFFSPQQVARLLLWVSANRAQISKLPLLPKQILQQRSLGKPGLSNPC